ALRDIYTYVNPPMLPNLVKLVIGIDCLGHRYLLLELLNRMPNLEHITFSDGISGNRLLCRPWNPSLDPPDCLCFKMKEIVIHNGEAVRQEELAFISYFLKHSLKLEKLTIIAHNIDPEKQEQLLNFSCGSMCQIELV
ncbi:F-box/RNI-like superfamily protein, partial [Tanacetum coccineum]